MSFKKTSRWDEARRLRDFLATWDKSHFAVPRIESSEGVSIEPAETTIEIGTLRRPYQEVLLTIRNYGEKLITIGPWDGASRNGQFSRRVHPDSESVLGVRNIDCNVLDTEQSYALPFLLRASGLPPGTHTAHAEMCCHEGHRTRNEQFSVRFFIPRNDTFEFFICPGFARDAESAPRSPYIECSNFSDVTGTVVARYYAGNRQVCLLRFDLSAREVVYLNCRMDATILSTNTGPITCHLRAESSQTEIMVPWPLGFSTESQEDDNPEPDEIVTAVVLLRNNKEGMIWHDWVSLF